MLSAALLSTFHVLALAIGLPSVVARARALQRLTKDPGAVEAVLFADNLWGIAAIVWLGSGLLRAFGPFEKGSGYYLHSGSFLLKMALFVIVILLELWPMATFVSWRIRKARGLTLDTSRAGLFAKLTAAEVALTLAIPFVASMMARGIGFTWFSQSRLGVAHFPQAELMTRLRLLKTSRRVQRNRPSAINPSARTRADGRGWRCGRRGRSPRGRCRASP